MPILFNPHFILSIFVDLKFSSKKNKKKRDDEREGEGKGAVCFVIMKLLK